LLLLLFSRVIMKGGKEETAEERADVKVGIWMMMEWQNQEI
jgi:hypothetical protein